MKKPTPIRFARLVPEDSFISRYMSYFAAQETATAYDFWCALWLLSVAMGRDVWIARPRIPVYLNMYLILVAESGVTRKSTAVEFAQDVCRAFVRLGVSPLRSIEGKVTPEQLETILAHNTVETGHAYLAFSASELVTVLGREAYMASMPGLLTDLFTSRTHRVGGGTLNKGDRLSLNVYVCFLGASTPVWLLRSINPDVVEGGFTSRCYFLREEKPKGRVAWFVQERADAEYMAGFADELRRIRERAKGVGGLELNAAALATFTKWYKKREVQRDPFRASFFSREDGHVLRVAGLLSTNDQSYQVQHTHITNAIRLVEDVRERGAKMFDLGRDAASLVIGVSKVRDRLIRAGRDAISQSMLTIAGRPELSGSHVRTCLDIMHELGFVQQFEGIRTHARGPTKTLWRATDKLMQVGALDNVMSQMMGE